LQSPGSTRALEDNSNKKTKLIDFVENTSNKNNLQNTLCDSHRKFLVLYANADSLHNKINELKLIISSFQYKPSLIAITEVKHKNKWQTSLSELTLSGYDLYSNDLDSSSRGIIVYVSKNIKSKQMYSNNTALEHLILEMEIN